MRALVGAVTLLVVAGSAPAATAEGAGSVLRDTWLTSKTKARLIGDSRVKATSITVETRDRIVTLRGKVRTPQERVAAEEIARSTDGVRDVANALQVVPESQRDAVDARDREIETAVKERLAKAVLLRGAKISVRADAGVVTLMGTVGDTRARGGAAALARAVPGVKAVRNELEASVTTTARPAPAPKAARPAR